MVGYGISISKAVKGLPGVGGFMSRIFKKPQTTDGYAKFCQIYASKTWCQVLFSEWFTGRGASMTAKRASDCRKHVSSLTRNWTKAQKADIQNALNQIRVIPDPAPPQPPEVHKVSASYSTQAQTQIVQKSRDVQEVVQAGISKIPIWVFAGIGALFILPQLLRTRGGKE